MKRLLPLLAGTLLSTHVFALDTCKPTPDDAHMRICAYAPNQRYEVNGIVGYPVDLKFKPDERIKRFELAYTGVDAKGNPAPTWRGPEVKGGAGGGALDAGKFQNNLPIWPFHDGPSALVVITARPDGSERPYQFALNATKPTADCAKGKADDPGCPGDIKTTAGLEFTYPTDETEAANKEVAEKKRQSIAAWKARQAKASEETAVARLKTDVLYGPRNFSYQAKADPKFKYLAPSEVSDNGWLTEMQWPANVQIPAITIIDPATGEERIAPVSQQGHMEVINGTAEWFRLRLGPKAVMDIHNLNWKATRPDPGTGTTSPDVVRQVIYRDAK